MSTLLNPITGILILLLIALAHANVEKTIFLAPPATLIPSAEPDLDDLGLERLSPLNPVVRTRLNASFPTAEAPDGTESWFFLENLIPGQRYEVRVCWLATQPTSFTLTTYPLTTAIDDPTLFSSLSLFSVARLSTLDSRLQTNAIPRRASTARENGGEILDPAPTTQSVLFLRVRAAADYFTKDETLMQNVSPVAVDLILDPFLWNVFPRSLVPTAFWMVGVIAIVFLVAPWIANEIGRVVDGVTVREGLQEDKKER